MVMMMNRLLLQRNQRQQQQNHLRLTHTTTTTIIRKATTTSTIQNHYYHQWKKRRPSCHHPNHVVVRGVGVAAVTVAAVVGCFLTEEYHKRQQQQQICKAEEGEDPKGYKNDSNPDSSASYFFRRNNPLLLQTNFLSSSFPFQNHRHHQQQQPHFLHHVYPQSMMKTLCEEQVQGGEETSSASTTTTKSRDRFGFITSWWRKKPKEEVEGDSNTTSQTKEKGGGGGKLVLQKSGTKSMLAAVRSKQETLEDRYDIDWKSVPIGEGAFGTVFLGYCIETGEKVAIKKEPKAVVDNPDFEMEMDALLLLKEKGGHKNICALRENFETSTSFLIVFDYIAGKELFEYLCETGIFQPNSQETARHIYDIVSALAFLHSIGIVHADLKCENIMLSSSSRSSSWDKVSGKMTVIDFGNAHILTGTSKLYKDGRRRVTSRSPSYCPPEVLRELNDDICDNDEKEDRLAHINPSFDMWSLGIVIYIMLVGMHPFDIEANGTSEEIQARILSTDVYKIPLRGSPATRHLSEDCINLIEGLLEYDPEKRLTAEQVLEHPWVKKGANSMQTRRRVYGQWPKKKNNQ